MLEVMQMLFTGIGVAMVGMAVIAIIVSIFWKIKVRRAQRRALSKYARKW